MKLIHCADLHLDSNLTTHLSPEQARKRKHELLLTFARLVSYAGEHDIHAILIAGDLFDRKTISVGARRFVLELIRSHPEVDFYYLVGNHDASAFLDYIDEMPENLKLFGQDWTTYVLAEGSRGRITLTGADGSPGSTGLRLRPEDFNIVTLHGQITEHAQGSDSETIDLRSYRNKHIDYLALGHVHSYQEGVLPPRGTWCYPGCLEGRGFDERGEHGFVLVTVDGEHRCTREFVPFASRRVLEIPVELSGCPDSLQVMERVAETLAEQAGARDMVRVVLRGEIDSDSEIDTTLIESRFRDDHYVFQVRDETRMVVDFALYRKDASLKGEFVRCVEGDAALSVEEKAEIIRCGLRALAGEEVFA